MLWRGARVDRDRPDLERLAAVDDPEGFVWEILPHAARSFAVSILLLPAAKARTAAVAYLYCRMLDTYEDLGDAVHRESALGAFADRMRTLQPPPPLPTAAARDDRDRVHLLLVERCELVDRVFTRLPPDHRRGIAELVAQMAAGMIWSARRFAEQGGVLAGGDQVERYCHHVIGEPALFTFRILKEAAPTRDERRDVLASAVMIQLANITRDIERDLARGVGYHPSLRPYLGAAGPADAVTAARRCLMAQALPHVRAYTRLARNFPEGRFSPARASGVAMLLYTDRHYRRCARRAGLPQWRGPDRTAAILLTSLGAAISRRRTERVLRRVEADFLAASSELEEACSEG
jgi:phytoene/squalene synthetase